MSLKQEKASKTLFKVGAVLGILLTIVGMFYGIATWGVLGIFFTLLSVLFSVVCLIFAQPHKEENIIEDSTPKESVEKRLIELKKLYENGLISELEYEEKRKSILKEL